MNAEFQRYLRAGLAALPQVGPSSSSGLHGSPMLPSGDFLQAEEDAAQYAGFDMALSGPSGTTVMNQIMLRVVHATVPTTPPSVVVFGDAHVSVLTTLADQGCFIHYVPMHYDDEWELFLPPMPTELDAHLNRISKPNLVAAVVITCPNYEGLHHPPGVVVKLRERFPNALILHDNAWGLGKPCLAHDNPDVAVRSLHKLCGSLQPGSHLYANTTRIPEKRLRWVARHVVTTSPSQPVLASNALATATWAKFEADILAHLKDGTTALRDAVSAAGLDILPTSELQRWQADGRIGGWDPCRVLVRLPPGGPSGFNFADACEAGDPQLLEGPRKLVTEKSGFHTTMLLFNLLHEIAQVPRMAELVASAWSRLSDGGGARRRAAKAPRVPMPYDVVRGWHILGNWYEAAWRGGTFVPLQRAVGRTSLDFVVPYPPGRPVLIPGQPLTREAVDFLAAFRAAGGHCLAADPHLETLLVLPEGPDGSAQPPPGAWD